MPPTPDLFAEIRKLTITALFADDYLLDRIVLKGGNALSLVYELSQRTSLDLDFSLEGDFDNPTAIRDRIDATLRDRFDSAGYAVFDLTFEPKPKLDGRDERPWWGGYELRFKFIQKEKQQRYAGRHVKMQQDAVVVGPNQQRVFSVDFSKHEFVANKAQRELNHYVIYVYTLPMIVIEKLRAICQQMPEYALRPSARPRARDFYDIQLVLHNQPVDLMSEKNQFLVRSIFQAKRVPLRLLSRIPASREFHRLDWPSVEASVPAPLASFDHYFDFVASIALRLQPLWDEQPPL